MPGALRAKNPFASDEAPIMNETSPSRRTKVIQGAVVFVLMFVTLWLILSRITATEEK